MTSTPLLRAHEVSKHFGHNLVLDKVSLDVQRGETVALIGPSGAGKSTFLRTLNMLESIDSGSIYLDDELLGYEQVGHRLVHLPDKAITRQRARLGMVFQQFNLFPHMTALENVAHAPIHVRGIKPKAARQAAAALLERVGLADRAGHYPSELSGGQQQRVAIARALANSPEVLLFDEPTSALDPELVEDVLAVMRELSAQGQTMIIVTHEMGFAREVADRVVFMTEGAVRVVGTPEEVFVGSENPRLRTFLSSVGAAA
ncbi:amino acid ABC transporter ATP-binding protein [Microbacterium sp. CPCC 204701]|uniref:amino acid ABC transporter ATP-binding protein n=1 Tax=Microbacterium sp. CPCC 204701 TaxID=2493084 RepID=UPI000FD8B541|nr:amino acid ABC transporter ATP-binding protein [Microbacterium sp. CPCC 204701]